MCTGENFDPDRYGSLVSWCFEPSQQQRILSGLTGRYGMKGTLSQVNMERGSCHAWFNPYHWVGKTCLVLRPLMLGLFRTSALIGPDNGTTTDGAFGGMRRMSAHSVCFFFTSRPDANLRWWHFTFKGNQTITVRTWQI